MIDPKSSFPVFVVHDLAAAKAFYSEHLGFEAVFANDWYLHLAAKSGVQVGFMLPDQPTQPTMFRTAHDGKGVIFSLEVEDADAAYTSAKNSALNIVLALRSEDWGQRHFCIEDPNGVRLDIVQAIAPTEEYQGDYRSD